MPKPPGKSPKVTFVLYPRVLADAVEARRNDGEYAGLTARRDLERYYYALRQALESVELSENEVSLLCDACNGTIFEPHTVPFLWAEIEDAIRLNDLDEKWGVDGQALIAKLRDLDYWQALAVVDAVERFWRLPAAQRTVPEGLRAVGLVRSS